MGDWDDFEDEAVRNNLPASLRERARRAAVGAFVIPTWCRSCLDRVWVWLGVRIKQLCAACVAKALRREHVFELVYELEGNDKNWDEICAACGAARNWSSDEQTPCPGRPS